MAAISGSAWRTILTIAGVALIIFLIVSGQFIFGIVLLFLLVALGGGALLSRKAGPPRR